MFYYMVYGPHTNLIFFHPYTLLLPSTSCSGWAWDEEGKEPVAMVWSHCPQGHISGIQSRLWTLRGFSVISAWLQLYRENYLAPLCDME